MGLFTLIVDDDANFRKLLEIRLRNWQPDIQITFAENILQARGILDTPAAFSIVILDQHLPDGLGHELFDHPKLQAAAVLAVSADSGPEVPARAVRAGAQHFLGKKQISEPLFIPLLEAVMERKRLEGEVLLSETRKARIETIKVLLSTLRHEINNPLGAVLGGAYLLRAGDALNDEQKNALRLIEESGNRIKHVITELCEAADLEEVTKGKEQLFQVPGDPRWGNK